MSTGLPMTSAIPAPAAEAKKSGAVVRERITTRVAFRKLGCAIIDWQLSNTLPWLHSPSINNTSGRTATAVASACVSVLSRVTSKPSRSKVLASKLRRPSFSSAMMMLAVFIPSASQAERESLSTSPHRAEKRRSFPPHGTCLRSPHVAMPTRGGSVRVGTGQGALEA